MKVRSLIYPVARVPSLTKVSDSTIRIKTPQPMLRKNSRTLGAFLPRVGCIE